MSEGSIQVGDLVRVKGARRRDVLWTVTEVSGVTIRAVNRERGAEICYDVWALERVDDVEPEPAATSFAEPDEHRRRSNLPPAGLAAGGPPRCGGTIVRVENGDIEAALRTFKKVTEKAAISESWRRHEHYEKPSVRRRKKSARARRRRGQADGVTP